MIQIKIERIGDDERWLSSRKNKKEKLEMFLQHRIRNPKTITNNGKSRAWCAKIVFAQNESIYIFKRIYLNANISYLESNSVGSRGVFAFYNLEEGNVYEVNSPLNWKHDDRYFCRIENNELIRMTKQEVLEWLKNL
jgi:hypothetical protein